MPCENTKLEVQNQSHHIGVMDLTLHVVVFLPVIVVKSTSQQLQHRTRSKFFDNHACYLRI